MCTFVYGYVQEYSAHRGLKRASDLWDMGVGSLGPLEEQEMLVAAEPALQQHPLLRPPGWWFNVPAMSFL